MKTWCKAARRGPHCTPVHSSSPLSNFTVRPIGSCLHWLFIILFLLQKTLILAANTDLKNSTKLKILAAAKYTQCLKYFGHGMTEVGHILLFQGYWIKLEGDWRVPDASSKAFLTSYIRRWASPFAKCRCAARSGATSLPHTRCTHEPWMSSEHKSPTEVSECRKTQAWGIYCLFSSA